MINTAKGFCDICGVSSTNMTTHRKTKKHINAVKAAEAAKKAENVKDVQIIEADSGNNGDSPDNNTPRGRTTPKEEQGDMREVPDKAPMSEKNKTIAGIQIIDSNTGKKQPSSLDRLLDIAFSPEIAPITLSIMDGIAKRLSGSANNEVEEGNLVKTVSGAIIKVPNKEF